MGQKNLKKLKLICVECQKEYSIEQIYPHCKKCVEPLEVEDITKGKIKKRSAGQSMLERYSDFLPFKKINKRLTLREGDTPLIFSKRLTEKFRLGGVYFKNETQNPTWSFKDRGTAVGILYAAALGIKKIGTVSTGNMAVSVAAYGARAGLKTYILVSSQIADEKLSPIAIYNPELIKVDGDYSDLYYESLKLWKEKGIYFINSDVPMRVEGSKTIAFEICEQMDFSPPDYVIVPTSAGGNFRGIMKGFREFKSAGLIKKLPKFICAQAAGCSPIFNAYSSGKQRIERVGDPHTIAHAIENPFPPSGNEVLRKLESYDGISAAVSDEEIIEAQRELALEGIFGQPAAAVPLAAIKKLSANKFFKKHDKIICITTGSGLKYTAALARHNLRIKECPINELRKFID